MIARARDDDQDFDGPPWPLTRTQIETLAVDGLNIKKLEDIPAQGGASRHWRAVFRRGSPQ